MSWIDGETIYFQNDDVVVHVRVHPRLHCIDVYYWTVGMKNHKFIGRYSMDCSVWELQNFIIEDHPELNLRLWEGE